MFFQQPFRNVQLGSYFPCVYIQILAEQKGLPVFFELVYADPTSFSFFLPKQFHPFLQNLLRIEILISKIFATSSF